MQHHPGSWYMPWGVPLQKMALAVPFHPTVAAVGYQQTPGVQVAGAGPTTQHQQHQQQQHTQSHHQTYQTHQMHPATAALHQQLQVNSGHRFFFSVIVVTIRLLQDIHFGDDTIAHKSEH